MHRLMLGAQCLLSASSKTGPVSTAIGYVVVKTTCSIIVDRQLPTRLITHPQNIENPVMEASDKTESGFFAICAAAAILHSPLT